MQKEWLNSANCGVTIAPNSEWPKILKYPGCPNGNPEQGKTTIKEVPATVKWIRRQTPQNGPKFESQIRWLATTSDLL